MAETVYPGYDNLIDLRLREDGIIADISASTKVAIVFNGFIYDSDNYPAAFDWTTNGANGILQMDLGSISGIETGVDKNTELIIYDANYPNGLVWGDHGFSLTIRNIEGTVVTP